jgi:hypothetical protein
MQAKANDLSWVASFYALRRNATYSTVAENPTDAHSIKQFSKCLATGIDLVGCRR